MDLEQRNLEIGKSFSRLSSLFMIASGFMFLAGWTFYNWIQIKPDFPKFLNYIGWHSVAVILFVLSLILWLISHGYAIGIFPKKKVPEESQKIKELFLDMFRGFPNYRYRKDLIENVIITETDRKELINCGYLLKEPINGTYTYRLGPKVLPLISTWKTEQVNEKFRNQNKTLVSLTSTVTLLTIVLVMLSLSNSNFNSTIGSIIIILLMILGTKIAFWDSINYFLRL